MCRRYGAVASGTDPLLASVALVSVSAMVTPTRSIEAFLERALSRGLITPDQHASLSALASEDGVVPHEMPRGFNWVTVAYALGSMLVVFAGGWFLAQRWLQLGPAGVLAVVTVYAAIAVAASRWLEQREFREAAAIAMMVAVSLTPVAVWAIESMTGWWPAETWGQPYYPYYPAAEASRWLIAELATILAGLLVLRRRNWSAIVFPVAVALFGLVMHAPRAFDVDLTPVLERWIMMTGALFVCAVANATDRATPRQAEPGRGDMAFPLWLTGLFSLAMALLSMWPAAGALRHGLPLLAIAAVAAALYMGRRTHLVFGVFALFMYLFYLAAEVFRSTAYFPIALAVLGGALLAATVWLQRRFPMLASRLAAQRGRRGGLPGSPVMPWLFVAMALGITLLRGEEAAEERLNREFQQRLFILRMHSGSLRPPPSRVLIRPGPDSPPPQRPPR